MSERKALTLAIVAIGLATLGVGGLVIALGGSGELVLLALLPVIVLGPDQISRIVMNNDRH
jgi:hypothetical protein